MAHRQTLVVTDNEKHHVAANEFVALQNPQHFFGRSHDVTEK